MAAPKTRSSPDGVAYDAFVAPSPVLAEISNTAADFSKDEMTFWVPAHQKEKVIVYVLELDVATTDFTGSDQASRIEYLSYPKYKPVTKFGSHGEEVINLLASPSFGVARSTNIKIIPVRGEDSNDGKSGTLWAPALKAIALHFKAAMLKGVRHGVMNCSRALEKNGTVNAAFKECVDAGIIVVGAAGNRAVNLDDSKDKPNWPLPEADDQTILIGSLNGSGEVYRDPLGTDGSSYGARVDYWVRGMNLAATRDIHGNLVKVNGTSFACPVAAGVIASMLSAGQVTSGKAADVRKKLDAWAVHSKSKNGPLKLLRNAAGLN